MRRRSVLVHSALAAAAAAPLAVRGQSTVSWRLASAFPRSLDIVHGAATQFADTVRELSAGKFTISVHAPGELMPAFAVVDGVQQGTVQICHTAPYYFTGKDETFALGGAIPFGLNSRQMTAWMQAGNGLRLMREFYARYNMVNFPGGNTGAQMGGWFRREVKTLEDLRGLKIRTGGLASKVLERMGAAPQSIPAGDMFASLENGALDTAEWVGPYDDHKLGLHRAARHYYYPAFWEGGVQLEFFVNRSAWAALPDEFQAIVEAASGFVHMDLQGKYDAVNPAALKQLVAEGAQLRAFPAEVMNEAFKVSMQMYEELSARNESWKRVYEDYSKFRADENLWFRFTEATFDRFLQAQKL